MNNEYFEKLIKYAEKCKNTSDVPVAAFIVRNGKIISKGRNLRNKKYRTINHAEIMAITKANKKMKSCFLYDCDLYVTLRPCEMCQKVINNSRINNVYYILDKPDVKKEYNKTQYIFIENKYTKEYRKKLSDFFNKLR